MRRKLGSDVPADVAIANHHDARQFGRAAPVAAAAAAAAAGSVRQRVLLLLLLLLLLAAMGWCLLGGLHACAKTNLCVPPTSTAVNGRVSRSDFGDERGCAFLRREKNLQPSTPSKRSITFKQTAYFWK